MPVGDCTSVHGDDGPGATRAPGRATRERLLRLAGAVRRSRCPDGGRRDVRHLRSGCTPVISTDTAACSDARAARIAARPVARPALRRCAATTLHTIIDRESVA